MPHKIEHRIGVQAPAPVIWEILSDLPAWSRWVSMYPQASGRLLIGERLDLTEQLPGQAPRRITPTVVDWVPNEQVIWQDKLPGLVRATRYLEIETLSETGCIFSNGQILEGMGAGFVPKTVRAAMRKAFTELGEAMKARAEAVQGAA
jgi:hypothetical protein